ncbi:YueI family protein [Peribacillus glennii]|uniref:DUF1694 domain-containing protein n=1 Tax=Peribacillus glennii TaxID=2303991 RepID=A0A372LFI9_9BACI|nr:YueI family protein [Peribacillus glennii]RFU64839.1 DUF1694 domain-containing protein [Peribacillus glennii]
MSRQTVDEVLQQGIHGKKEIKPEERRKYLGTLRERVVVVLSQGQVREKTVYPEITSMLQKNPTATLLLNGAMEYSEISKYIDLATKHKVAFKIVADNGKHSDLGLVLAYDTAIDKEIITVEKRRKSQNGQQKKQGFFSRLARKLKRKR